MYIEARSKTCRYHSVSKVRTALSNRHWAPLAAPPAPNPGVLCARHGGGAHRRSKKSARASLPAAPL
eukprot:9477702-Pyramimonas_sp.AAC.1